MKYKPLALLLALGMLLTSNAFGQYFGRNKANYESFDFEVYQTPNFDIYHYLKNQDALDRFAQWSETWHDLHQRILGDTIRERNPLIIYNDHADFQQTNAVMGAVGVGTGGVTEAFKNRVVMPFGMSNQQTFHVLGHELVHAFQYNMILRGDSTSLRNLANLPLWMVEGLAEYMSLGSVDAHTAMWMRDAVLNDNVPTIKDLENPKYFPYRYGQAFWSFVTGLRGDEIIAPLFRETAMFGLDMASRRVLGMNLENLSELWVQSIKRSYEPYLKDSTNVRMIGRRIVGEEVGGRINISPVISPDGRYVIFLSEKDLFSIDLFLADISARKIIRKVASTTRDGHIDDFDFIESAGTWSPDSRQFAFVGFKKGRNVLIIKNVANGRTEREAFLEGVQTFGNPEWSPDGRKIVVAGLVQGQVDLYTYDVRTERVEQLTDDAYSEMHPYWIDDNRLVFSTDRVSMDQGRTHGKWKFNLATLDLGSGAIDNLPLFPGADNLDPTVDPDGNILFLSNRDGFRNIYLYQPASGKVFQVTDYLTGVSGITHYAPALSIATRRNRLMYTYYTNNRYQVYYARPEDYLMREVDPMDVDMSPAYLPRVNPRASELVNAQLDRLDQAEAPSAAAFQPVPYRPKFKLDYISGSAGVGVGSSQAFGTTTGLAGGIDMLFSDILGDNSVFTSLSLNGEIYDFGGVVGFINRKNRLHWGASISHIPYRSFGGYNTSFETLTFEDNDGQTFDILALKEEFIQQRIFEEKAGLFASFPFSKTLRLEADGYFARYSQRVDVVRNYYETDGYFVGQLIKQDRDKLDSAPGFNLANVGAALVGDNSYFGLAAPLTGHRFRIGVDQFFGEFNYTAPTIDYRFYRFYKPVGVAFRAYHYGRYGGNDNGLYPLYLGQPWFLRGYNSNNVRNALLQTNNFTQDHLFGNKMLISNLELRIPFTGPERLALFKSGFLFSDLNVFLDGGLMWNDFEQFTGEVSEVDGTRFSKVRPLFSTGVSLRINVFGAMVIEPYYAFPLVKGVPGTFGVNFMPGW